MNGSLKTSTTRKVFLRTASRYLHTLLEAFSYCVAEQCIVFNTCIFAGELCLGVTHPFGALAVFLITPILAVLIAITTPALWDAGSISNTVEFLRTALNHRWQH